MKSYIKNYIVQSVKTKEEILSSESILAKIEEASKMIIEAYKNEKKVLIAGNGGSAADAQHISAELVSKFLINDRPALNAVALTTNTSILTAVGNDYSHDYIFARQVQAYGAEGDIYIAISTSGESKNIIYSIEEAKRRKLKVIGFTGMKESSMDSLCDLVIKVPSLETSIIQESHIMLGHIVCAIVEKELFKN